MTQLKKTQVKAVKLALDAFENTVRAAMRAALAESRREQSGSAAEVHDLGDESVADELLAINSALAERHGHELHLVERARQRITEGEIGICADCAGDIALERLIANPVAERCVTCESRRERTHAHAATPRL